jgi:excisionase family DNA binding protein
VDAARLNEKKKVWIREDPVKEYYSVQETSQILGVGAPSVYSSIKRGSMPGYKVGGKTMVKHEDLVAYIAQRQNAASMSEKIDGAIRRIEPEVEQRKDAESMVPEGNDEGPKTPLDFLD